MPSVLLGQIIALITVLMVAIIGLVQGVNSVPAGVTGGAQLSSEQRRVARDHRRFMDKGRPTFREFCFPDKYRVQKQQAFLGEYMDPHDGVKTMLAYHEIGAGKTCAAIQVAERYRRPIIVLPASLIGGFRAELRTPCVSGDRGYAIDPALKPGTREWKAAVAESNEKIDRRYTILSYNKFVEDSPHGDLLVIDEVHNVSNADGSYYAAMRDWVVRHPRSSVLIMTATPVFDSPAELNGLAGLLRIEGEVTTPADVARLFAGHVSYYAGAPAYTFPEKIVRVVKLPMSPHQARWYKSEVVSEMNNRGDIVRVDASNNFYSNTRQRANVAFPRGLTGDDGLRALTVADIRDRLGVYSCKMAYLRGRLRKRQLTFIYSAYTGAAGIDLITKCLRAWGYRDYFTFGPGRNRYAVFSGETSDGRKDEIRTVFNDSDNDDGSRLSIIVGSPAMNAGVSLLRVRAAHLIDLYWNHPRLDQICGRTARFCSHKILPREERNVKIYLYAAYCGEYRDDAEHSIDAYMLARADDKKLENEPFLQSLRDVSVDRGLH